jgi:ATPase subunit of ABC transporter with duplicated ATPase domains
LSVLNDDWTLEERCNEALSYWQLDNSDLKVKMQTLSCGQKTKVFLAGIKINNPEIVLLDEPTNHLDLKGRDLLCRFIQETSCTVAVVSHDRTLLNQFDKMCELNRHGIKIYGGDYDFYKEQKTLENAVLVSSLEEKQKSTRKAKETESEAFERQQKRQSQARKNTENSGIPKILLGGRKNASENSAGRLKSIHTEKINDISQEISDLRKEIPARDKMKFGFDNSNLHKGKILVNAKGINYAYNDNSLWLNSIDLQIISGERIEISGDNGSGKTTLIKLILGNLEPACGTIFRACKNNRYIDHEYSLINGNLTVYEQAQAFNNSALQESEIKTRLNRFLFSKEFWDKPCAVLSGGEKMRLLLCCLTVTTQSPDIIVLDEPTNNLDIQNIEILTNVINDYYGTLIVVSHDQYFLKQINIERIIEL